jgi:hypothetical protein
LGPSVDVSDAPNIMTQNCFGGRDRSRLRKIRREGIEALMEARLSRRIRNMIDVTVNGSEDDEVLCRHNFNRASDCRYSAPVR